MIETKKEEPPYWEKYREPKKYKDSKDFVEGYNQALDDFHTLLGTKPLPDKQYREATTWGGIQINNICEKWRLVFK